MEFQFAMDTLASWLPPPSSSVARDSSSDVLEDALGAVTAWAILAYGVLALVRLGGDAARGLFQQVGGGGHQVDPVPRWDQIPMQLERMDDDDDSLVSKTLTEMVEMTYWIVKLVGDFEKGSGLLMKPRDDGKGDQKGLFGEDAASIVKFVRYTVKFIKSFEKLSKI